MPISIYPPTLESTQPAFLNTTTSYPIYFTLQRVTSLQEIGHIQIRVVKQSNNKSIVRTGAYPDGIIYKNISAVIAEGKKYFVAIQATDLQESWQPGFLYKIQLRFGKTSIFGSVSNFATWKQEQINNQTFSEWSTVMVIKAIAQPNIYIKNAEAVRQDVIQSGRSEATRTPLFTGAFEINADSREAEDTYRFELYRGAKAEEAKLIEDSGWIQHNASQDSVDYHRFSTLLDNNGQYTVVYYARTVNGYSDKTEPYTFLVNESSLSKITDLTIEAEDDTMYCSENGCINIYLQSDVEVNGSYVIIRSSEKTNFQVYEDLKHLLFSKREFPAKTLVFQDFTIESGVRYRYGIQQENRAGLRTTPLYEEYENNRMVNFEYSFLYHDDVQLRLQFNNNMTSFKHTVLSSKQDTLGDKYPHVVKNGYAYYAEFPVTGLISLYMDEDQTFFKRGPAGYYYREELVIPYDKYLVNDTEETFNTDLLHDNIFVERKFREKVEEFLNNFDYKLYKSPTEGNMVIVLQGVSLTPRQELGRMIYEFSATAYEVLENTIQNLNEYKIIDIGSFMTLATEDAVRSFGQIHGLYTGRYTLNTTTNRYVGTSPTELLDEIRKIEEVPIAGGYKTVVKKVRYLWIEQYPHVRFDAELIELQAQKAILDNLGEDTSEVVAKIKEYQDFTDYLAITPETKIQIIELNGREIVMGIGKIYQLDDIDEDINSIQLKFTSPVILNYVVDLVQREDEDVGVISSVDASRIWGQISGIFTTTDKILKNYNFRYRDSETNRVFNLYPDSTVVKGPYGDIILDNTSISLYKSMNIEDIIREQTKRQVEIMYGIANGFTRYDETTKQWDNGTIYYKFNGIYLIDIEADPGTILYVGKSADGSDKTEIVIGDTGRYRLNPAEDLVRYVQFKFPQFAIINYKCLTSQMIMSKRGG